DGAGVDDAAVKRRHATADLDADCGRDRAGRRIDDVAGEPADVLNRDAAEARDAAAVGDTAGEGRNAANHDTGRAGGNGAAVADAAAEARNRIDDIAAAERETAHPDAGAEATCPADRAGVGDAACEGRNAVDHDAGAADVDRAD